MKSTVRVQPEAVGPVAAAGREDGLTRSLLLAGIVAGPFYLAVGLLQALIRPGFDLARHPLSLLANGPGGWVQTANFILTGLLVVLAAWGISRLLGRRSRAVHWALAIYGISMLLAAVFRADPVDGFPLGTPEGVPTEVSTTGLLHFIAGGIGFIALAVAAFAAAAVSSRLQMPWAARLSLVSGLAVVLGFFGSFAFPGVGTLGIWLSVVVGWLWLALIAYRFRQPLGRVG